MIDVWSVLVNALWIAGLAAMLAAFSWANWVATSGGSHLRAALATPAAQRLLRGGLALFCAGLAATWVVQLL